MQVTIASGDNVLKPPEQVTKKSGVRFVDSYADRCVARSNHAETGGYAGSLDLREHAVCDVDDAGAFGRADLKRAQSRSTRRLEMLPDDAGHDSLDVQAIDVNGI